MPRLSRAARRCLVSRSSRERAVSAAEEFCIQMHTIGWSLPQSPSKSNYHECVGGNSKEIFELFTNKLVFSESVSQRWRWWSWLAISSLDAPLERSAFSRIIMKEFLFSIWFISLSSNLKAFYRYIYQVCEACIRWLSVHFCEALLFKTRRRIIVFFIL